LHLFFLYVKIESRERKAEGKATRLKEKLETRRLKEMNYEPT